MQWHENQGTFLPADHIHFQQYSATIKSLLKNLDRPLACGADFKPSVAQHIFNGLLLGILIILFILDWFYRCYCFNCFAVVFYD